MDHICVIFPLLPGKTEKARAFQRELNTERKAEYDESPFAAQRRGSRPWKAPLHFS